MTLKDHEISYTQEQLEQLDRALEAQYRADRQKAPPAHEYAEWKRVRRAAAERRFQRVNPRTI
jgi:hypothetical protein